MLTDQNRSDSSAENGSNYGVSNFHQLHRFNRCKLKAFTEGEIHR